MLLQVGWILSTSKPYLQFTKQRYVNTDRLPDCGPGYGCWETVLGIQSHREVIAVMEYDFWDDRTIYHLHARLWFGSHTRGHAVWVASFKSRLRAARIIIPVGNQGRGF